MCVSYNEHDMQHTKDEIRSQIARENCPEVYRFTISDVKEAVQRLKPHKSDGGAASLSSDYIINAGDDCFVHIAVLLNAIVVHGKPLDNFFCTAQLYRYVEVAMLMHVTVQIMAELP